jgi:hypothetical protein
MGGDTPWLGKLSAVQDQIGGRNQGCSSDVLAVGVELSSALLEPRLRVGRSSARSNPPPR